MRFDEQLVRRDPEVYDLGFSAQLKRIQLFPTYHVFVRQIKELVQAFVCLLAPRLEPKY